MKLFKKQKKEELLTKEKKKKKKYITLNDNIINNKKLVSKNKGTKGKKKKRKNKLFKGHLKHIEINNDNNSVINNINLNNINRRNKKRNNNHLIKESNTIGKLKSKSKDNNVFEKAKNILQFNDDEKNELPYVIAVEIDNRTFLQYYLSLLKTKHNLIFSFCHDNNYNSKIIQMDLFFIGFSAHYTVSALFYNDDTMHDLYIIKGSFTVEYQLRKNIYTSLISMFLNTLLKHLALSNDTIIKFKQNKETKDIK